MLYTTFPIAHTYYIFYDPTHQATMQMSSGTSTLHSLSNPVAQRSNAKCLTNHKCPVSFHSAWSRSRYVHPNQIHRRRVCQPSRIVTSSGHLERPHCEPCAPFHGGSRGYPWLGAPGTSRTRNVQVGCPRNRDDTRIVRRITRML